MEFFAQLDVTVALIGVLVLFFVLGMLGAVRSMFSKPDEIVERLRSHAAEEAVVRTAVTKHAKSFSADDLAIETETRVQQQLRHANITHPRAVPVFVAAKALLAAFLPLTFLAINQRLTEPVESSLPIAILLAVFGLFLPNFWLSSKVRSRQKSMERTLPDALDLLVTCVEAGLGLDAALARVAGEIRVSSPILADELRVTFLEIGAGMARVRAFRRLAERTGVEDIRSLSAVLAQTERFGTSIAKALRIRAEWMRTKRMQTAEEKAAVVSVKMTVPLVLCILPSLVAIIMGPAAVRISTQLLPYLGGK
ncbi:MAG: hypothetical protein A2289_16095 [Deltaproteobacteria bacterium RIFOXYA12_FULL_58_15]|nr:MAG: hypothetical protein A2289_16095 [Deltaproteobacteria bacterium RIFOXYA12_FULL_58_15]OGR10071.1 MAG: hypothetical protein A2341_10625 [Deltaproteobacteria bacterium RIFOXYB12_FULL_58_9]